MRHNYKHGAAVWHVARTKELPYTVYEIGGKPELEKWKAERVKFDQKWSKTTSKARKERAVKAFMMPTYSAYIESRIPKKPTLYKQIKTFIFNKLAALWESATNTHF